ncbi:MAG: hypothetical protein Q9183_003983, partial [Haloplaca sp. 2 TL-2023]
MAGKKRKKSNEGKIYYSPLYDVLGTDAHSGEAPMESSPSPKAQKQEEDDTVPPPPAPAPVSSTNRMSTPDLVRIARMALALMPEENDDPAPNDTAIADPNDTAVPAPNGTAVPAPNDTAVAEPDLPGMASIALNTIPVDPALIAST